MEKSEKFDVSHNLIPVRAVFGNGVKYRVPRFQRRYSWGRGEWEDLWSDIKSLMSDPCGDARYLGYIVLREDAESPTLREVIDGQQRLTTISIFALAIARLLRDLIGKNVDPKNNEERFAHLKKRYLVIVKTGKEITKESRLEPGQGDKIFYQRLVELHEPSADSPSQKKMWEALRFFEDKIREHFHNALDGGELAEILDDGGRVANGLVFTEMTVKNENDAYMLFEILNGRGVELTGADLVKNYLFLLASDKAEEREMQDLESKWEDMVSKLGRGDPAVFLRYFCHSRDGKVIQKRDLFRKIKGEIKDGKAVFSFLEDMMGASECYRLLQDPNARKWSDKTQRHLSHLKIYGVLSLTPLLLAAYRGIGHDFERIVRNCVALSFRHAVIGNENPKDLERDYVEAAGAIARGEAANAGDVLPILLRHYPSDQKFVDNFRHADLRKTKVIQHILFKLDRQASGRSHDSGDPQYTIEHILPKNPGEGWQQFENPAAYQWRLGNLAVLTKDEQCKAGNRSFADKIKIYRDSEFALTRKLAEYQDWTQDSVGRRQREMANLATAIWKLE